MDLEEETQKIKTLVCFQSEEIPIFEETPLPNSMEIQNPFSSIGVSDQLKVISSNGENPIVGIGEIERNPNCSEFEETLIRSSSEIIEDQKIDETLDLSVKEEEGIISGDAEIKKIVEDSMNDEVEVEVEGEDDDFIKTLSDLSPVAIEGGDSEVGKFDCNDMLNNLNDDSNHVGENNNNDEGEEELGLVPRSPWSEGHFRNYCNCVRCNEREEGEEEWDWRTHGMGGSWFNPYHNPRRHCRRKGHGFRREREAEFYGLNDRYRNDRYYNERFPQYLNVLGYNEPEPCAVGAGLANLGNTCFLNAILQCFTHTVPLVQGLLSVKHEASSHGADEFCVLCAVRDQIECSIVHSGRVISPANLVDNLSHISSYFRRYQQEDAHEFLQCLLDKLDSNLSKYEAGANESPSLTDTLVKQIFGGRLVSQVRCCSCGHHSDTYEPLIDLSLEIENADNVEDALKSFTKVESIELTENFKCASCNEKVKVEKQLILDQAPSVAALHLKRFKSDGFYVEKNDKKVDFPLELDLSCYSKGLDDGHEDLKYELYAVVVHVGLSSISGHYFCYIRTSPKKWYRFDDSKVTLVEEESVLCQDAYILFYAKKDTPWFDSLIEKWKAECQEKIRSTSPKSVLVDMDFPSTSFAAPTGLFGGDVIESRDSCLEVENKPGVGTGLQDCEVAEAREDANGVSSIAPVSELVQDEGKAKTDAGVAACDLPVSNQAPVSSSSVPTSSTKVEGDGLKESDATEDKICMEIGKTKQTSCGGTCSPSDVKNTFDGELKTEASISPSTPPRALSPDIYSDEEPAEEAYSIPINHLKIKDKPSSAKKSVNSLKQDIKRKEAAKYIRRAMSGGRGQLFMAAINGSKSDSMLSKKRRKQAALPHVRQSPKKRVKVSPKRVLRPVTA